MYRVGIIGVGTPGETESTNSMGYSHALAYERYGNCRIVAASDTSQPNLDQFARRYDLELVNEDYRKMLYDAKPDIVSVSAYAGHRRQMIEAAVTAGCRAIWCEKPFALTMDDGRAMVQLCEQSSVKLVVHHQRRYVQAFRDAKRLLRHGTIGNSVEFLAALPGWDLTEWGAHWIDAFRFFADDQPVTWVMGQARCTGAKHGWGHLMEEHALAYFCFEDGTRGVLDGGVDLNGDFAIRIIGTQGLIDIQPDGALRVLDNSGWRTEPKSSTLHGPIGRNESDTITPMMAVLHGLISWIEGGPKPDVSGDNALKSTEIYLAAYESAYRGNRVDLPLVHQSDFPLNGIAKRQSAAYDLETDNGRTT